MSERPEGEKREHGAVVGSAFAGLIALLLYLSTRCPNVYWYDSAEYAAAAATLGIPHPPGYPLYTLIAHACTWLPLSAASATSLLSALAGAAAVGLAHALARALGAGNLPALAGAAVLAVSPALWHNASVAEVYAPGLCFTLGVWLLLVTARGALRRLLLASVLAGLGLGVHYSLATCGLGFVWLVARGDPAGVRTTLRRLASCGAAVLLGASVFAYIPLRAVQAPAVDQLGPPSVLRIVWMLIGGNYRGWFGAASGRPAVDAFAALLDQIPVALVVVAVLGAVALWRRSRATAQALLLGIAGNMLFFADYRVHDVEVFLLPSAALLAVLCALGVAAVGDATARRSGLAWIATPVVAAVLAFVAVRVSEDYRTRDLSDFVEAERYAQQLERELPRGAVIVTYTTPEEWKHHTVFAMYWQQVLGRRSDVIVVKGVTRATLDRLLAEGRAVYLYSPVEHVGREYALEPEGAMIRIVGKRPQAVTPSP